MARRCRSRTKPRRSCPDYFVAADDISPVEHVDIQAASQKWIDSSISKTANVPTDYPYEDFKDIYRYAHRQGLKGCTTFRFNPAAFQGVLVKEHDLENTTYRFELEDGSRGRGQGQRRDRIRRRDTHRRQPVRCAQGRLLRQILSMLSAVVCRRSRRDRRAAIERRTYDLSRPVQITGEGNLPCRTKAVSATRSTT